MYIFVSAMLIRISCLRSKLTCSARQNQPWQQTCGDQTMNQPPTTLDALDKKIIQILQDQFPLVERPYKHIGDQLNLTEDHILSRLKQLQAAGVTQKIGAVLDTSKIGQTAAFLSPSKFHSTESTKFQRSSTSMRGFPTTTSGNTNTTYGSRSKHQTTPN
jgi:DNA-binding Lrp family transcriptional regulator